MDKYYDETAPINAFITNLGRYNEGALIGQWVSFPTDYETMRQVFKDIGIDGIRYEEFFITDYDTHISGLHDKLGEYENLDELNYLAASIEELDNHAIPTFEAALEYESCNSIKDIINLIKNVDCYSLMEHVTDEGDLGAYVVDEGLIEVPDHLINYIDHEAIGRDWSMDCTGAFTDNGYLEQIDSPSEIYDGKEIPEEYRVMSEPADMDMPFEEPPKEPERLSSPLKVYIINYDMYLEGGKPLGKWVEFPTDHETVRQALNDIAIDGVRYQQYHIEDYESKISGLENVIGMDTDIDKLNYLATVIDELTPDSIPLYENALKYENVNDITDAINLTASLDQYHLDANIRTHDELGRFLVQNGFVQIKEDLIPYVNYVRVGEKWQTDNQCSFTKDGYIEKISCGGHRIYDGKEVPDEYRVMSKPAKPDISIVQPPKEPEHGR